jgi:hypothetical protein
MENKGIELELGWRDKIRDFGYNIRGTFATLKNEVTRVHESVAQIPGTNFHTATITMFEKGYPAWYFYGYKVLGIDPATGDPIFKDTNNKEMIGNPVPDLTYGITLSANWRGIDLTVFGTGAYGNEIFLCQNRGDRVQSNKLREFYDDRWTPSNPNASKPRPGAVDIEKYWLSDAMVYDGSYFKIKQIQLGYSLKPQWLSSVKITNLRAYLSFDDCFTFTKYPLFDPEYVGAGNAMGLDKGYYPSSRKIVCGVNVTF